MVYPFAAMPPVATSSSVCSAIETSAPVRLHIFGASGTGTTTLGATLAQQWGWLHLDADDFFWRQTAQPYSEKIPQAERVPHLLHALHGHTHWVISGGSLYDWAQPVVPLFTHVVFLRLDHATRMQRLQVRERARFGDALDNDPERRRISRAFFDWAAAYDTGGDRQRSWQQHQRWIAQLYCPVLQLDTREPVVQLLAAVQQFIQKT